MRLLKHVFVTADESRRFAGRYNINLSQASWCSRSPGTHWAFQRKRRHPPIQEPSVGRLSSSSGDSDAESDERTPMQSMFPATCLALVEPAIPIVDSEEEEEDRVCFPLHTLTQLHATQHTSDNVADDAALRAILHDMIRSGSTEVLYAMQVGRRGKGSEAEAEAEAVTGRFGE